MGAAGKLIIIGGAINLATETPGSGILHRVLVESVRGKLSRIEIIPTASKQAEAAEKYIQAFNDLGATNVGILDIKDRSAAFDIEVLERIRECQVVFFTGGDQLRLTTILGGTPLHDLILQKYNREDFLYVGTSAGASCISKNMIYEGDSQLALQKGQIKTTAGLGLLDHVVIDTHFSQRGRIGRLFQAVVSNPKVLGIGLDEDTALLIRDSSALVIGSGQVIVVDGRAITDSNLTQVKVGSPISIKNLVVHVLSPEDVYDLLTHQLTFGTGLL